MAWNNICPIGPIEKGATDGQTTYCVELVKSLKAAVSSPSKRTRPGPGGKGTASRRRKRSPSASFKPAGGSTKNAEPNWGLLEPIRGVVSPVTDIFAPFVSANLVISILLLFILFNYLRTPRAVPGGVGPGFPVQKGAYEAHWYAEEGELWEWLDRRIGVKVEDAFQETEKVKGGQGTAGRMKDREVKSAIKRTEETLKRLKRGLGEETVVMEEESTS